ncbi:hypothetical protein H4219_004403, partial [Mycoemilia scoparia]
IQLEAARAAAAGATGEGGAATIINGSNNNLDNDDDDVDLDEDPKVLAERRAKHREATLASLQAAQALAQQQSTPDDNNATTTAGEQSHNDSSTSTATKNGSSEEEKSSIKSHNSSGNPTKNNSSSTVSSGSPRVAKSSWEQLRIITLKDSISIRSPSLDVGSGSHGNSSSSVDKRNSAIFDTAPSVGDNNDNGEGEGGGGDHKKQQQSRKSSARKNRRSKIISVPLSWIEQHIPWKSSSNSTLRTDEKTGVCEVESSVPPSSVLQSKPTVVTYSSKNKNSRIKGF